MRQTSLCQVAGSALSSILHLPFEGRIKLVDHSKAFSTSTDLDLFLGQSACALDRDLERALRSLGPSEAEHALSPWLNRKQIEALLARRDGLLDRCRSGDES